MDSRNVGREPDQIDEDELYETLLSGNHQKRIDVLSACCDYEIVIQNQNVIDTLVELLGDTNDLVFLSALQTLLICVAPDSWRVPDFPPRRGAAYLRLRDELSYPTMTAIT